MSAPTKGEQVEEYARSLGMTHLEFLEMALEIITDSPDFENQADEDAYHTKRAQTLEDPGWMAEHLFQHQAWDAESTVIFGADFVKWVAENFHAFDT